MGQETWVFAYGSLMWDPGFVPAERVVATLTGYARRFCLRSIRYRGTPDSPGLVLALDPDPAGQCQGIAYRVAEAAAEEVLAYLHAREMIGYAYAEAVLPVVLADGRTVRALAYVLRPGHPQHWPGLSLTEQAAIIARAAGPAGTNRDYLLSTLAHLAETGIEDAGIAALGAAVAAFGAD